MSVPNAVLILYFFASLKVLSVPANTSIALSRSNEPGGNASASSSGNACSAQPDALLGDQLGGRFVHQMAVLDALHAGGDRALDGLRRVRVHGDVGAPVLGGFNGGAQLGLGEGGRVERAVGRRHPPARRQLDLRRAQHELLAHAHADLIRAVGDHGGAESAPRETAELPSDARHFERLAEVAVTAGDGDDGAGREDARTGDDALVDGALEPERRPAHVANGGESAHQRVRSFGACHQIEVADVPREQRCGRRPHQHRVPVRVDQPGHQRAPAAVDERGGGAAIGRDRICGDALDLVPADENVSRP